MKMIIKIVGWTVGIIVMAVAILIAVYYLGPRPPMPDLDPTIEALDHPLQSLDQVIATSEAKVAGIKPDNEARIVWANDSVKQKTKYAVVYLHGWTASPIEGNPVHLSFAERYGCNLYLARLHGHGVELGDDNFGDVSPENLIASVKRAISIGKLLGDSVILMGTSTGCTYSLYMAANLPDDIHSLILYSPNIEIYDPRAKLLAGPWAYTLAKQIQGSHQESDLSDYPEDKIKKVNQYWTKKYRVEALITLQMLLKATMKPETFQQIKQPVFLGYYYKNEQEQDQTVSVQAMLDMFEQLGTPSDQKRKIAMPQTGVHPIASDIYSQDIQTVMDQTYQFAEEILKMEPKQPLPR